MAVHHPATIVPTKMELLQSWVPGQPWLKGVDAGTLTKLGSYRFDDPDGEVGIETHLLSTADGLIVQVPLTYYGAPRDEAEASLITTMTHTTLGDRWIYDACLDPVYVSALVSTVLTGGREADLFLATDSGLVPEPVTTHVRGSGRLNPFDVPLLSPPVVTHEGVTTRIEAGVAIKLLRVVRPGAEGGNTLTGTWPGQHEPVVLAVVETA